MRIPPLGYHAGPYFTFLHLKVVPKKVSEMRRAVGTVFQAQAVAFIKIQE